MAINRGPHVRELFIGHQAAFEYAEKESKKSYNITKKNKGALHPKLGAYKPKILSEDASGNIALTHSSPERSRKPPGPEKGKINKAFVIGDKDVPMMLEPSENIYSEIQEPVIRSSGGNGNEQTTSNPLFSDSSPVRSPTEHQGNVYRDNYSRSRSVARDTIHEEINGVAVPVPDYDEDEMTLNFETDEFSGKDKHLYREFAGEDFAQYMSDDEEDYEFDRPHYTVRSRPPVVRNTYIPKEKKSKTEAWRGDKQKRDSSKALFNKNTKHSGKSTLRHFSVNDTKLGIGLDGTIKQPKPSFRDGVPYDSSYESFLQSRNGGPRWGSLESASSDSGHETGDDVIRGGHEKHSPFWKKLTVKIKKVGYGIKH